MARLDQVNKQLARAKSNQYRANILKQVNLICSKFNISAKKKNTNIISQIISLRIIFEQLMVIFNVNEPNHFFDLLMSTKNINSVASSNPALLR